MQSRPDLPTAAASAMSSVAALQTSPPVTGASPPGTDTSPSGAAPSDPAIAATGLAASSLAASPAPSSRSTSVKPRGWIPVVEIPYFPFSRKRATPSSASTAGDAQNTSSSASAGRQEPNGAQKADAASTSKKRAAPSGTYGIRPSKLRKSDAFVQAEVRDQFLLQVACGYHCRLTESALACLLIL